MYEIYYKERPNFRDYQKRIRLKLDYINQNTTVQLPTGTGKSVIFMDYILTRVAAGDIGCVVVPNEELIGNVEKYLLKSAPLLKQLLYSPVSSKRRFKKDARLFVGTYQSVLSKYDKMSKKPTVFIHDEAHHARSRTWEQIVKKPGQHVAFTATPIRLDGKSLIDLFPGFISSEYDIRWFINHGYLSDFEIKSSFTVSFDNVGKNDSLGKQAKSFDTRKITGDAVSEWKKHAHGKKTIVFCTTKEHCQHVLDQYKSNGISAVSMTDDCTDEQRRDALKGFKSGKYMVIINITMLTEGVDVPDAECCQLLRFTYSTSLYYQMVGRVLRVIPGKKTKSVILDHAGNVDYHMSPDIPIDWGALYNQQIDIDEATGRSDKFIRCECCDSPLMLKKDLKYDTITIHCPSCTHVNEISGKKKPKSVKVEKGELKSFQMSIGDQLTYKIVRKKAPFQVKVKEIADLINNKRVYEDDIVKALKSLYQITDDSDIMMGTIKMHIKNARNKVDAK